MGLSAEDKWQIRDLIAKYNIATDSGDVELWISTFTDDAIFESPIVGYNVGREQLLQCFDRMWNLPNLLIYTGGQHRVSNLLLSDSGDFIEAKSQFILTMPNDDQGPPRITVIGSYHDRITKVGDGWRFSHRRIDPYPLPSRSTDRSGGDEK